MSDFTRMFAMCHVMFFMSCYLKSLTVFAEIGWLIDANYIPQKFYLNVIICLHNS